MVKIQQIAKKSIMYYMLLNKDFYFTTAAKAVVIAECIEDRWRRQLGIEPRVLIDQSELAQGTPSPTATDDGSVAAFCQYT
ncbi:Protocadherin-like protein [Trichinella pseudospiralis]